jgi:hypothetical protein
MSAWLLWLLGSRLAKQLTAEALEFAIFLVYNRALDLHQLKCLALCVDEALVERGRYEDIKQSGP